MNIEHLVDMANEIGAFFLAESGAADAPQAIATHLTKFWDPRMRAQIVAHAQAGGAGLSAAACRAALLLAPVAAPTSGAR